MRMLRFLITGLAIFAVPLAAQIPPETLYVESMPEPGPNWFIAKTGNGGYVFDAVSGQMQGMVDLSRLTPAVQPNPARREIYAAEQYYSRGVRGERTDVVTVYDYANLAPVAEVVIPPRMARIGIRGHLALTGEGRYLAVFNLTPAQSVSIVDVEARRFVGELSTPGCAVMMPVAERDFLMLCGDGTVQLIQLAADGSEANRVRSAVFFDVQTDPVFDRPVATSNGWLLVTHQGRVFQVATQAAQITVTGPWWLTTEDERAEKWRPGGGSQFKALHRDTGFLYIAMHQGGDNTHHESGTEVWVVDSFTQRVLQRMTMETPVDTIGVTQDAQPKLIIGGDGETRIHDALSFRFERTINLPSAASYEDF
ncbi:MAG: amine dehydrogenase large subunit [Pseudohongiellaceae bacterium]